MSEDGCKHGPAVMFPDGCPDCKAEKAAEAQALVPFHEKIAALQSEIDQARTERRGLTPQEIRRIGAMTVVNDNSNNMTQELEQQRRSYQGFSKDQLIEEMVRRDKNLMLEGRQLADGRMATNLLRELVRHMLALADQNDLKHLKLIGGEDQATLNTILKALGAPEADNRMLRLYGTTLGSGQTAEERAAEFAGLADGSLPHTSDNTTARPDVAQAIRDNPARVGVEEESVRDAARKARKRQLMTERFTGFDKETGLIFKDGEVVG